MARLMCSFALLSFVLIGCDQSASNPDDQRKEKPQVALPSRELPVIAESAEQAKPIKVGETVPNTELKTVKGEPILLNDALGGKPTVLVFYRGGWCPFCTSHLRELNLIRENLDALGYQIIAIAPEGQTEVDVTIEQQGVDYTILSDSMGESIIAFGLAFKVPREKAVDYADKGRKLARSVETNDYMLPVPAVFLVDGDGKILFSHYDPNYQVRLSSDELLAAAKKVADE